MNAISDQAAPIPAHIPPELVRDIDVFRLEGADRDAQLAWKRLQEEAPPFFWTPHYGGYWIATRGPDIRDIQLDHARYSQRVLTIPPSPTQFLPSSLDPPAHEPYRNIIMPAFLPRAINRLDADVRAIAEELVEAIAPRGECEFVEDFARKMPIAVFMKMVDLPYEDREILLPWTEDVVRGASADAVSAAFANLLAYIAPVVKARQAEPKDDLISVIVNARIGERAITPEEIDSLLIVVIFGGLDTVTSLLSFVCGFLATHPDARRDWLAHPELKRNAVEELIRRHGVVNTARYITEDHVRDGVQFKAGDLIQIPNALVGLDPALNEDPLRVDFRRERIDHAAFGSGPHTCPGAVLARREIAAFMDAWLATIPEFGLKPGTAPAHASGGVNGVSRLELAWAQT